MKMGSNIGALGTNAFAGGDGSTASGTNAFAFGDEAKALNTGAFASGLRAEASGTNSIALGRASKAANENTIALGYVTEALTPNAVVIGKHARVVAGNSYIIGSGLGLGSDMLENNVGYSIMIGMKSNVPTFFVGPSNGAGTTGRIGIGNMTDPQAKLHILADEGEAASLRLEHQAAGENRYAELALGNHTIRAGNFDHMTFTTPANKHFVFENGNVGIGLAQPEASLHVQGNMKMGSNIGAVGTNAFAGGEENQASGQSAFSYGKLNQASGPFSIALGRESKALDHAAIALGYHAEAKVGNTIAIGKFVESTSSSAITIGTGTGTGSNMLRNNFSHSFMLGFYSNLPTFFVGSSNGAGTTGSIGIGNMTAPQAKLHMLSDEDEAATLKLEHRTTGTNRYAEISLGTHSIRAGNTENMVFSTPDTIKDFVFENGNVGIGLDSPSSAIEIYRDEEPEFKLSNIEGNIMIAVVNTPWHYAPTSQPGDVVFKTHYSGNRHGMIFNMNDDYNDGNSYIKFNDNYNHHTLTILNNGYIGFGTDKPKARIHVEDGDIYLHDIQSGIIMKSPDGQCWRGRLNEMGNLTFTAIDCPADEVNSQPELNTSLPIRLFPNPTSEKLTITHEFTQGPIEALVYNMEGALLLHRQFDAKVFDLSLEHLVSGTYIVSLKHQNQVVATEKVVKN